MTKAAEWVLKPGDVVCDWLGIMDPDSRMLFRLFINLSIYAKISVLAAIALL
ncbi:MAG: hypothetical protein MI920_36135 [Kiloniellales bacterium]|nr:hypothetical protein [Kiloniellales bacterium]